jgi:pimeloyl-ACP methyl ester carboxylesterase
MAEQNFAQRQAADGLPFWEAGAGDTVVAIVGAGGGPTRAHALLAERRRVFVFELTESIATAETAARRIAAALAALGVARCDVIGEGTGAAAALSPALAARADIGAVVLAAPDAGAGVAAGETRRPVLVLAGTNDRSGGAERYRALLPDSHFMLVYDVGTAIGAERPEALAFIAAEFFERRDLFLVSRESGMALP